MRPTSLDGFLMIDKPGGMTSRDAVDRAQRWFPHGTRLGHTGTLDPLATGLLVLCAGVATRLTEYVQDMGKTYRAGVLLGARSDTDDADGTVTPADVAAPPAHEDVGRALTSFVGAFDQVPPAYSAAKVAGRRAYDLARRGREVELRPRRVQVYGIDILGYHYPKLDVEVRCGKGTYIRALARDLGERLGCGGLIASLRRTRVGPFDVADAVALDADAEAARAKLLPLAVAVSDLPRVTLGPEDAARLRQGQGVPLRQSPGEGEVVAAFGGDGGLIAVAKRDRDKNVLRPDKVFLPPA